MTTPNFPHILVIRTGAIGDTIVMSVVFQALKQHYPQAYIEALGSVERLQLINTSSLINNITSLDLSDFTTLFVKNAQLPQHLVTYFQSFDIILLYSFDPEGIFTKNLCKIYANQVYRFDPFPPEGADIHITTYLLKTLEVLGVYETQIFPEIAIPKTESQFSSSKRHRPKEARIAIHPGSGSPEKNWDVANFTELCFRVVHAYHAKVVLIAGPAEKESTQIITSKIPDSSLIFLQNMPLPTIAEELRRCHVYVGNDSGISHLAAAVGIPTIAIFGPSNPHVWRPLGKHVVVLRADTRPYCVGVSVEQVFNEVTKILG
jgi:ADP-heptose:LPS heptosyltransferase